MMTVVVSTRTTMGEEEEEEGRGSSSLHRDRIADNTPTGFVDMARAVAEWFGPVSSQCP